jgi:CheY-like chemotaxis protein
MPMSDSAGKPAMCRVLIVEDEALVRMFAVDALEDAGFAIAEAANASDALKLLQQVGGAEHISAVVVDLGLPDRPGDQLAAEIRKQRPDLPILIASGRSEKELKERFAIDDRVAIMVKPYTGPMLLQALQTLGVVPHNVAVP